MLSDSQVKPYRIDLGTGCMRSRDYPVVKTSISFFLFLFFSLCVSELFFLEMRIVGHILRYFGPRIETKASLQANSKGRCTKLKSVLNPIPTVGGGGGGGGGGEGFNTSIYTGFK